MQYCRHIQRWNTAYIQPKTSDIGIVVCWTGTFSDVRVNGDWFEKIGVLYGCVLSPFYSTSFWRWLS